MQHSNRVNSAKNIAENSWRHYQHAWEIRKANRDRISPTNPLTREQVRTKVRIYYLLFTEDADR
jgi:hypothetical protein